MSVWASRTPLCKSGMKKTLKKFAVENDLPIFVDEASGREFVDSAALEAARQALIPPHVETEEEKDFRQMIETMLEAAADEA
jgi:cellulose biosynthesis protein BcsQ